MSSIMTRFIDARIPVMFVEAAEPSAGDAVLLEGEGAPGPGREWFRHTDGQHPIGCMCCGTRNQAGLAIARLMLARGRGAAPYFTRILVVANSQDGRDAVLQALAGDPIAAGFCRAV